jgi:hypothetical protein
MSSKIVCDICNKPIEGKHLTLGAKIQTNEKANGGKMMGMTVDCIMDICMECVDKHDLKDIFARVFTKREQKENAGMVKEGEKTPIIPGYPSLVYPSPNTTEWTSPTITTTDTLTATDPIIGVWTGDTTSCSRESRMQGR